jgi:REP element-mobilizing transposase RayT
MERYRFHPAGALYFVTFSVVEWLPVFVSEAACKIVTNSLNFCHHKKGLRTNAYVIMPSHFHAVLFHEGFDGKVLENVLTDFRKFTGRQLADFCQTHLPACFEQVLRKAAPEDRDRRFWQSGRHPEQIDSEGFGRRKVDYLHENPCRKGLVIRPEYWRFSSASYWLSGGEVENDVVLSAVDW